MDNTEDKAQSSVSSGDYCDIDPGSESAPGLRLNNDVTVAHEKETREGRKSPPRFLFRGVKSNCRVRERFKVKEAKVQSNRGMNEKRCLCLLRFDGLGPSMVD